jgi:hypothetical protein
MHARPAAAINTLVFIITVLHPIHWLKKTQSAVLPSPWWNAPRAASIVMLLMPA